MSPFVFERLQSRTSAFERCGRSDSKVVAERLRRSVSAAGDTAQKASLSNGSSIQSVVTDLGADHREQ